MQNLKILYVQADLFWENPEKNRKKFSQIIEKYYLNHDLIILPETFTTGFPVDPKPFAESIDGETALWMQSAAKKTGAVITGSFLLKDKDKYYNTMLWVTPGGRTERYDKRHVFSMGGEDKKITKGTSQLITTLKGWKIKPMICYDLRFPVWGKNTYDAVTGFEYDFAIYVANWPSQRNYPWKMLLIARAIENQAYVIGVNRVGNDGIGNFYSGNSMTVDPKGKIISEAQAGKEEAKTIDISKENLENFRKKFNVGRDWDKFQIKI